MKTHSFPRGGFVYRCDAAPKDSASRIAFLPTLAVIPLLQHAGAPAAPVVSAGDLVREGMVIGRSASSDSTAIHSSIPGKVLKTVVWRMPDGRDSEALVVRLEGSFEKLGRRKESFAWNGLSLGDLQRTVAEKGVVEMEGLGRPIAPLLAGARKSGKKTLLAVNAVFDDSWLAAERAVLAERAEAVAEGVEIAMRLSGAAALAVAAAGEQLSAVSALSDCLTAKGLHVDVAAVGKKYPQRNLRELGIALRSYFRNTAVEFETVLPLGPSTLAAVHDAVRLNMPLIERYVAVGGDAVKRPAVLRLRIGTRIGDAIAECGGFVEQPARIVIGSPLTGSATDDLDTPISKTTSAIVVVGARRMGGTKVRPCIGCGNCRSICPVGLDPERLYKLTMLGRRAEAEAEGAGECHGCACCAAVCPSRLPLRAAILLGAESGRRK